MTFKIEENQGGTQAIERAVALVRQVSIGGHDGMALFELAASCRLRKSTAHRILTCLVNARLVKQRPDNRHYVPGPMLFELGLSSHPERGELQQAARARLKTLAKETSGVAFLFFRSGDDSVCAVREGPARCKAKDLAVFPGTRRPLVLGAGGVAVLIAMPKAEADAAIRRNLEELSAYREVAVAEVRNMLTRSFKHGVAINDGDLHPGVNAFGLALRDKTGEPFASIALAGPKDLLPLERLDEICGLIEAAAKGLQAIPSCAA